MEKIIKVSLYNPVKATKKRMMIEKGLIFILLKIVFIV